MLAIVVTLGGYLAGLHWLINPPDPWQPNPRMAQSNARQSGARKPTSAIVKPAEASVAAELVTLTAPAKSAGVDTASSVQASGDESGRPSLQRAVQATRPAPEPANIVRREVPTTRKSIHGKRVDRNSSRKLQLMVLRTYERSDGKRFTRLLSLNSVRNASGFPARWSMVTAQ